MSTEHIGRHRVEDDVEAIDRVADAAVREIRDPYSPRHSSEVKA